MLADTDLKRAVGQGVADALAEYQAHDRGKVAVVAQESPAQ